MSKEKAIVHINNVSKIIGSKRVKLSEGTAKHIQNELCLAKKELEDWLLKETMNSMDKEFIKGQLKSALFWLNTSNTKKNILHAKDSINMALKELEDLWKS